jgi:hypothetical protein
MTNDPGLVPGEGQGKTILYRSDAEGRLEATPTTGDYRDGLRSRRWQAAPLANPEVEKTDPRLAVAAIALLALLTVALLVIGYGVGIWSLPG